MTLLHRIAAAMYEDNLRQLNAIAEDRALRHGYSFAPTTHQPFADAEDHVRAVYLSYAKAAIESYEAKETP